jgi:superfamily II DNA helicase RecQ
LLLIILFLKVHWIALTATANEKTVNDIIDQLQLRPPQKFKSSTYRANLYYDVIVRESLLPAKAEVFFNYFCLFLFLKF